MKAFWFVWNESGNVPKCKHESFASAEREAERLARNNQGQTFIILQSVGARVVDGMQRIDLRPDNEFCDEIPF